MEMFEISGLLFPEFGWKNKIRHDMVVNVTKQFQTNSLSLAFLGGSRLLP